MGDVPVGGHSQDLAAQGIQILCLAGLTGVAHGGV